LFAPNAPGVLLSSVEPIPEPVANAARFMSSFERPWALCGGWAVDAWLGRVTRTHLDIDITLFGNDVPELFDYLRDWNFVAHDEVEPQATWPWNGRVLALPGHIHARPPGERNREIIQSWVNPPYKAGEDGLDFDFELTDREGELCVLSREPRIEIDASRAFRESPWGIPALVPEAIAFYKATAYYRNKRIKSRPHDVTDFEAILAVLDIGQRRWLKAAIAEKFVDHEWLPQLE
jgi:hypothetical protein